ncbi:beta-lactamase family protein [candidate division WWE3 bacterium]|nr:beta-lactamase family protein [candidate division WWE3 bacterium]
MNIDKIFQETAANKLIEGMVLNLDNNGETWTNSYGNFSTNDQFFIASVTKLFITALLLQLIETQKISLTDPITKYLPEDIVKGLHVYQGIDYSSQLTITHLMSHTSGLPDYFEDKNANQRSLLQRLLEGNDMSWTFNDVIQSSKILKPHFIPGEKGKAHYSDTNFQLLEEIIEYIYEKDLVDVLQQQIFTPLGLSNTYLYTDATDTKPHDMYYQLKPIHIPQAMTSFRGDGGIVSTAQDLMTFIKAFFSGTYYPVDTMNQLYVWNRVMFPLEYGIGIMKYQLPAAFTLFRKTPMLIGHSGLSGAFAFYCPDKNLYMAGTINQISKPQTSFQMLTKILMSV